MLLLNQPCYQSESSHFYSMMKPLMLANKLDTFEIFSNSISTLTKGRGQTDIHDVYVNLSEYISLESVSCDPYMKLFYGHLAYAVWREKKEQWNSMKTRQSSSRANYSFGWDGKEEDEEEDLPIDSIAGWYTFFF